MTPPMAPKIDVRCTSPGSNNSHDCLSSEEGNIMLNTGEWTEDLGTKKFNNIFKVFNKVEMTKANPKVSFQQKKPRNLSLDLSRLLK
jgi:hypothetical protein